MNLILALILTAAQSPQDKIVESGHITADPQNKVFNPYSDDNVPYVRIVHTVKGQEPTYEIIRADDEEHPLMELREDRLPIAADLEALQEQLHQAKEAQREALQTQLDEADKTEHKSLKQKAKEVNEATNKPLVDQIEKVKAELEPIDAAIAEYDVQRLQQLSCGSFGGGVNEENMVLVTMASYPKKAWARITENGFEVYA